MLNGNKPIIQFLRLNWNYGAEATDLALKEGKRCYLRSFRT